MMTQKYIDDLTYTVIGCGIEVHKELGPGLLESVYEKCFIRELSLKHISYRRQEIIEMSYKGIVVEADLRFDVLVHDVLVVELKAVDKILPVHQAQLLTYMKLMQKPKGLLLNFNCCNLFKEGQKTLVNDIYAALPKV